MIQNCFLAIHWEGGGASFAHAMGASLELIQAQGDWASMAVLVYLTRPIEQRVQVAELMAIGVKKHNLWPYLCQPMAKHALFSYLFLSLYSHANNHTHTHTPTTTPTPTPKLIIV